MAPQPDGKNSAATVHPYAAGLAETLMRRSNRRTTLKFRTLLGGFGYYRRTEAIIADVKRQLQATGVGADFTVDVPKSLDDRVTITLVEVAPVATETKQEKTAKQAPAAAPAPAPDAQGTPDAIERALSATVDVLTEGGSGTGFIVHQDGLVVTARHVVEDEDGMGLRKVKVRLYPEKPNEKTVPAVVFRSHRQIDFALLWLLTDGPFPVLPIGDPQTLRPTQPVFAIGSPAGMPNIVSRGIVGNPTAHYRSVECIQTDAAIDHGNSGGPLVTDDGKAVGIAAWGLGDFDALKFAVPIDYLTDEIALAIKNGRDACLAAAYCPSCGYTEYGEATWYCRNCGYQTAGHRRPAKTSTTKE